MVVTPLAPMADFQQGGRSLPEVPLLSQMTQQGVQPGNGDCSKLELPEVSLRQPEAKRPWSAQGIKTTLSPSPTFIEARRASKDDHDIDTSRKLRFRFEPCPGNMLDQRR